MSTVKRVVEGKMSLTRALKYCGVSRQAYYYKKRPVKRDIDMAVAKAVTRISSERPTYGTRMLAYTASYEMQRRVNRKKVVRICNIMDIKGPKMTKKQAIRAAKARKPQFFPTAPYQLLETDITYIYCGIDGWCYCFNVFDVFTRRWLGYVFSTSAKASSAVQSVTEVVAEIPPERVKGARIRCDNGSQYRSGEFRAAMKVLDLAVEYIWVSTPQQNGHIESFHNTLKRDYVRPHDFESFQDAEVHLAYAFKDYNANRVHSSIGWVPPDEFFRLWERNNREGEGPA